MGNLARFLACEIERRPPRGWTCNTEARLLDPEIARRYGFDPRADVMFVANSDGRRVAIELEISRADPVANQVKFLLAMRAGALSPGDALVAMFSPAIVRGRRNRSAAFVRHLRTDGLSAFQVALLPQLAVADIKRLNHASAAALSRARLPIAAEVERIFAIVEPRGERAHRIHFAGDVTDVVANVWAWNDGMATAAREHWGDRPVQYFVHDPISDLFAPSKFCAFVPAMRPDAPERPPGTMTLDLYATLGEQDPRFDGHRAWKHLTDRLAFSRTPLANAPRALAGKFEEWVRLLEGRVKLRQPVQLLRGPQWYAG